MRMLGGRERDGGASRGPFVAARALALAAGCAGAAAAGCATIDPPAPPTAAASRPPRRRRPPAAPSRAPSASAWSTPSAANTARPRSSAISTTSSPAWRRRARRRREPYRVTILDSPVVNAFALPSGEIFITRGLLALANDGSEVAAVMAHEIAHVTPRHAAQRAELEKTAALFTRVSNQVLDRPQEGEAGAGAHEAVDRAVLARAGVRGRPDRHRRRRQGGLRPLRRRALPRPRSGAGARCALR